MTQRREPIRFKLTLPLEISRIGMKLVNTSTSTRSISSREVLMVSRGQIPIGESIQYTITISPASDRCGSVLLCCVGKVVRHEGNWTAATIERYRYIRLEPIA